MSHDDLPNGCELGIPVFASFAAEEIKARSLINLGNTGVQAYITYAQDTLLEMGRTVCSQRNVCMYELIPQTSYTFETPMSVNGSVQNVQFTHLSLLHFAVKENSVDIAMIVLLLDPAMIKHKGILHYSLGTKEVNPIDMALLYHSDTSEMYKRLRVWKSLLDKKFFSLTSASTRIKMLGSDRKTILLMMGLLGCRKWPDAFRQFVDQDMYVSLIALGSVNIIESILKYVQLVSYAVSMPLGLLPLLPNVPVGQSIQIQNMNLLHYALIKGKYEAAAALLVLCPEMAACKAKIAGTNILLPARMFVKLFPNEHSEDVRFACFKIVAIAEQDIRLLEPLGLPTRRERVTAAGRHAGVLLHQWTRVHADESITNQWHIPAAFFLGKRSREPDP